MLINKWFGVGILAAIAQKTFNYFCNQEEQKLNGRLDGRLNFLGLFQVNLGIEPGNLLNQGLFDKNFNNLIDNTVVAMTTAYSFASPVLSIFNAFAYLSLKILKIVIKANQRDARQRKQCVQICDLLRLLMVGVDALLLIGIGYIGTQGKALK